MQFNSDTSLHIRQTDYVAFFADNQKRKTPNAGTFHFPLRQPPHYCKPFSAPLSVTNRRQLKFTSPYTLIYNIYIQENDITALRIDIYATNVNVFILCFSLVWRTMRGNLIVYFVADRTMLLQLQSIVLLYRVDDTSTIPDKYDFHVFKKNDLFVHYLQNRVQQVDIIQCF